MRGWVWASGLGVVGWFFGGMVGMAGQAKSAGPAAPPPAPKLRAIEGSGTMELRKEPFGKAEGKEVDLYTLVNRNGLRVKLMTYGATLTAVQVPDRHGKVDNITLYLDTLEDYLKGHPFFGSTVGRYANRIAFGRFTIDGLSYQLATNNNRHHIHGGRKGFDKYVWSAEPIRGEDFVGVVFSHTSPDGDEHYPGTLQAKATYTLNNQNELRMIFEATTDKPTHVNICNHAYWNLAGAGTGTILDHIMMLNADKYLPVDKELIPLGDPEPVFGTPMDFLTEPKTIGSRIHQVPGAGYDHCYVLRKEAPGAMTLAARVVEPNSGRVMEVYTTQPGVQFYTGNFLDGSLRAGKHRYPKHAGFCLETQHFPDSPNRPSYPSTLLRPGQTYREETIHKFSLLAE